MKPLMSCVLIQRFERTTSGLTVLAVFFGVALTSKADTLELMTDTTWRAIGPVGNNESQNITTVGLAWEAGNDGWNDSLAYDDSDSQGWVNAIFNGHENIPKSIWPSGDSFTGPTPAYFRRQFNINGTPTSGLADLIIDDDVQIYVNGDLVFNDTNGLSTFANGINFTSSLVPGTNLIAMKAHDQQGTEGIGGTFRIDFEPVPEPSAGVLCLLGLAGVLMYCGRLAALA